MIPQEDEPVFDDESAKSLYDILHIKSEDVGFHWNTNMLMLTLLTEIAECETMDDVKTHLFASHEPYGELLWNRIEPRMSEIRGLIEE